MQRWCLSAPSAAFLHAAHLLHESACLQEAQTELVLDSVPYAANGSFTVNLWMRRLPGSNSSYRSNSSSGNSSASYQLYQYLYSHAGDAPSGPSQSPSQVAIYLPAQNHPAYGSVRVIVMDDDDSVGDSLTYLDSNGSVGTAVFNSSGGGGGGGGSGGIAPRHSNAGKKHAGDGRRPACCCLAHRSAVRACLPSLVSNPLLPPHQAPPPSPPW